MYFAHMLNILLPGCNVFNYLLRLLSTLRLQLRCCRCFCGLFNTDLDSLFAILSLIRAKNNNIIIAQHLRPTKKSSMMHHACLPPSNPALPTTDGSLSYNATRSQMSREEVTNTLQVSVPLCPRCVCVTVCLCVYNRGQRASFLQGEEGVIDSRGQPAGRKCHHMLN